MWTKCFNQFSFRQIQLIEKKLYHEYIFVKNNSFVKLQKVFTIGNENKRAYPSIRESLIARGWVEKCSKYILLWELTNSVTENSYCKWYRYCPLHYI